MSDFYPIFFMAVFWMVAEIYSRVIIESPAIGALCQLGVGVSFGFIFLEISWLVGEWVWNRLKKELGK
jgi:hypothetical protein